MSLLVSRGVAELRAVSRGVAEIRVDACGVLLKEFCVSNDKSAGWPPGVRVLSSTTWAVSSKGILDGVFKFLYSSRTLAPEN